MMDRLGFRIVSWSEFRDCLYGLPLLTLPLYNILISKDYIFSISFILTMISASIVEEVVFRGVILDILSRYNWKMRVFISGFAFSIFHLVNLLGGKRWTYVVIQVLLSFVIGICFAVIAIQTRSILVGVIVHIMINLSAGKNCELNNWIWICFAIYMIYGMYLCAHIKNTKGNKNDTLH